MGVHGIHIETHMDRLALEGLDGLVHDVTDAVLDDLVHALLKGDCVPKISDALLLDDLTFIFIDVTNSNIDDLLWREILL
jgi:hypothetical protein